MLTGILLLVAFLVVVFAIVRGQSPIIMLLALAIVWAVLAGIGINDIQSKILQGGGVQYASAVIIIVFGAWFAQVLIQTGIAESVIRSAVELTGDRPMVTAMTINLVTALLFTSMYGVGAAIAIGVIALAIMFDQGLPPRGAPPVFAMGAGRAAKEGSFQGRLNLFNKAFYDAFPDIATIAALWTICGMIIVAGQMPQIAGALRPIFDPVLPHTTLQAAIFFAVLGGIGSIYRGPLVGVGTGAALLAIILSTNELPVLYL